jgi:simple sugar transport system ATP-binding protein
MVAVRGVHVHFGATHALDGVTLDVRPGEVLGLVGTNGAGKSTLIKVLSGVYHQSTGDIEIDGRAVSLPDPLAASRAGIQTVHQNIDHGVVPGMSIAENLALDSFADGSMSRWASPAAIERRAAEVAAGLDLRFDLHLPVEALPASERQQLIIARALARDLRLLILDEPTSTLSAAEAEVLFKVVRRLAAAGVAVIYISHYLGEIEDLCDRVAVLRDGRLEGVFTKPLTRARLVEAMLGELVGESRPEPRPSGEVVLELRGVRARSGSRPIDLVARRGEIVGLTGLIASGKTELLQQVFGIRPLVDGEIRLLGRPFRPPHPYFAVGAGVAYVPEERGKQALIPEWSVAHNLTLPYLKRYQGLAGLMRRRAEAEVTARLAQRLSLVYRGPNAPIESLSGGNQQKVVVARWLQADADLLILDEPFRGIDVGARRDIGNELRESAANRAVIVASSDPEEILEVSDRIVVMAGGEVVGEVPAGGTTTRTLARMMSGVAAT